MPRDTGTDFPELSAELVVAQSDLGTYSASWVFPVTPVQSGLDLYVSWDGVSADGWDVARPSDSYPVLALLRASTDRLDLADRLALGDVESVLSDLWFAPVDGETSGSLSDLGIDPADFVAQAGSSWLLALCDTDTDRLDIRAGLILEPTVGSGQFLDFPDLGSRYDWEGTFGSGPRTQAGYDAYSVDFSGVTTDIYGQPFDPSAVDQLFVGRYPDAFEGDDLAGDVHDLATPADGYWTMPLDGGTTYDLSAATSDDGPFPGFESGVAYLIGTRCTTCFEPAPAWVVGVEVR